MVPTVPGVEAAVARGDWDAARSQIEQTDPRHRDWPLRVLAAAAPYPWAAEQARDALGHTVAGAVAVATGWRARTRDDAANVSATQFASLWEWLAAADAHIEQALAADSADPTPAVYALMTARGREKPLAEAEKAFAELRRRDPEHLEGHMQRLQYSCEKWFGSHDQMHNFANAISAGASPGSQLHVLPLVAHVERLIAFSGKGAHTQQRAYTDSSTFKDDVREKSQAIAPDTHGHVLAHNILAFFGWIRDDVAAFDLALSRVGGRVTRWPWEMYGDDPVGVARARTFRTG